MENCNSDSFLSLFEEPCSFSSTMNQSLEPSSTAGNNPVNVQDANVQVFDMGSQSVMDLSTMEFPISPCPSDASNATTSYYNPNPNPTNSQILTADGHQVVANVLLSPSSLKGHIHTGHGEESDCCSSSSGYFSSESSPLSSTIQPISTRSFFSNDKTLPVLPVANCKSQMTRQNLSFISPQNDNKIFTREPKYDTGSEFLHTIPSFEPANNLADNLSSLNCLETFNPLIDDLDFNPHQNDQSVIFGNSGDFFSIDNNQNYNGQLISTNDLTSGCDYYKQTESELILSNVVSTDDLTFDETIISGTIPESPQNAQNHWSMKNGENEETPHLQNKMSKSEMIEKSVSSTVKLYSNDKNIKEEPGRKNCCASVRKNNDIMQQNSTTNIYLVPVGASSKITNPDFQKADKQTTKRGRKEKTNENTSVIHNETSTKVAEDRDESKPQKFQKLLKGKQQTSVKYRVIAAKPIAILQKHEAQKRAQFENRQTMLDLQGSGGTPDQTSLGSEEYSQYDGREPGGRWSAIMKLPQELINAAAAAPGFVYKPRPYKRFLDPSVKTYKCYFDGCSKCYSKSAHLKAHLRRHTGNNIFLKVYQ